MINNVTDLTTIRAKARAPNRPNVIFPLLLAREKSRVFEENFSLKYLSVYWLRRGRYKALFEGLSEDLIYLWVSRGSFWDLGAVLGVSVSLTVSLSEALCQSSGLVCSHKCFRQIFLLLVNRSSVEIDRDGARRRECGAWGRFHVQHCWSHRNQL